MPKAKLFTKQYQVERWIKHEMIMGQSMTVKMLQAEIYYNTGKEYSAATVRSALENLMFNGRYVEHISRTEWRRIR